MTGTAATIAIESPLSEDVRALIAELNEALAGTSPPEFCFQMTAEEMAGEQTTVFVARVKGEAAACGALHRHGGGIAEVKRMFTRPGYQGNGLAGRILERLLLQAEQENFRQAVLETGATLHAAWRVYERAGFTRCGPVLDYPDSPYSVFYSKPLVADKEITS